MRLKLLMLIGIVLFGCATVPPTQIAKPERLQPLKSNADSSKSIFVANVAVKLVAKKIGQMKGGTLCVGGEDLIWSDNQGVLNAMKEQIVSTLSKHGYNVYTGLIQARGEKDADILIGVGIEEIRANMCYSVDGMKGEASLTLKWEVLENKLNNSFTTITSGAADVLTFSKTGDPDVFVKAVEMATENLLAQETFFKATRK
jgi:hypothetical protein